MALEYISRKGMDNLKVRLRKLVLEERPNVVKAIKLAREFGDLSENAEYHAAKERQRFIEKEITKLQIKIGTLEIFDPAKVNQSEVRFSATVELLDLRRNRTVTYQLVGDDETGRDGNVRKISCNSPIGKALLGSKVGEEVQVKAPAGLLIYKINNISY